VIDIAGGTGLNFPLIEELVGPDGRIVGVDLTDAMLARAQDRIETNGWSNISLVQADAVGFDLPAQASTPMRDGFLSSVASLAPLPSVGHEHEPRR
jgi:ubiquinone/menaquinone biosynthesis C-methylase UbiE